MSISLPLLKETTLSSGGHNGGRVSNNNQKLTVESCLQHFTTPEMLTDPVFCPNCSGKTPTKKQHVVSKLPKVLCLHLKRFDAANNKKIEEFVSFPCIGLNMGPFLPHWCEVSMSSSTNDNVSEQLLKPEISYDLFGTVNHFGNLQSGYVVMVQITCSLGPYCMFFRRRELILSSLSLSLFWQSLRYQLKSETAMVSLQRFICWICE
jgi:ubiquitin carboxyl-terminal hydrolase 22/27/51